MSYYSGRQNEIQAKSPEVEAAELKEVEGKSGCSGFVTSTTLFYQCDDDTNGQATYTKVKDDIQVANIQSFVNIWE